MSARDDLLYEMTHNHLYMDDDKANIKIDAYAHELAEQIRNSLELRDLTDDHMSDCYAAADLIDPGLKEN